ncbi:MAG TPA: hypothetical protein DD381_05970 [Lentisphaeria bacterium]|nr:MAG: hypothetical protein A2X47_14135 [Lentisphaerae bacterium GWF2_38_69]HBM15872.1 hypothetical protein [Lentisphaeria bacterium]
MTLSHKNKLIMLMSGILLFAGMATDIYVPSLPFIAKSLKASNMLTGLTISIYIVAFAFSGLAAASFSDHFGRKTCLKYANIVFLISTGLLIFVPNIQMFILLRIVQGLAGGFFSVVTRQIIKDLFDEKEQININAIIFTSFVISPAVAPILGAFLAYHFSWRSCFIFIFILEFLVFIGINKILKETLKEKKEFQHPITTIGSVFLFFLNREFNAVVLVSSLAYGGYFAFITISSFIFINHLGYSQMSYSTIFLILAAVYLTSNFLLRVFNNIDMDKHKIILYGCILNFVGAALLIFTLFKISDYMIAVLIIAGAALMRFGLGLILSLVQVVAINLFKKSGGLALGTLMAVQCIFAAACATWATHFHNPIIGLFVVSLVFCGGALVAFLVIFSKIPFPHIKYKLYKKILHEEHISKFIE